MHGRETNCVKVLGKLKVNGESNNVNFSVSFVMQCIFLLSVKGVYQIESVSEGRDGREVK